MLESIGKFRDNALLIFTRRKRKADELTEMLPEKKLENNTNIARDMCFQDPDILCHILSFSNNPSIARVSRSFYHANTENLRREYNKKKEPKRAPFYVEKDGSNQAVVEQQSIVKHFLKADYFLCEIRDEVLASYEKLSGKHVEPFELRKFLYREHFLNEFIREIIRAKRIAHFYQRQEKCSLRLSLFLYRTRKAKEPLLLRALKYFFPTKPFQGDESIQRNLGLAFLGSASDACISLILNSDKKPWWHLR